MNSITFTNADGTIVTLTKVHHPPHYGTLALAALGLIMIGSGLYLLLRKEKPAAPGPGA